MQTFKDASSFHQTLCWSFDVQVIRYEMFEGTLCDSSSESCLGCPPTPSPSLEPSTSLLPTATSKPSLIPSRMPSFKPTVSPTESPTNFFSEECLQIVDRTMQQSTLFTIDYTLRITGLCELDDERTDQLQSALFTYLNAAATDVCGPNLSFIIVTLDSFVVGRSCGDDDANEEASQLLFSIQGVGKNCQPHSLPAFESSEESSAVVRMLEYNFLQELLLEAGFSEEEVESVDVPTGGMEITTQTEFETYSGSFLAPEGKTCWF